MQHSLYTNRNSSGQRRDSRVDHVIAARAWRQYGVLTREELLGLGLSEDAIDYRVAIGRLRVIHRAVYAVGHERLMPEGRWLAAVRAGGDQAALSHRSAARLWGLLPRDAVIEVAVPRSKRRQAGVRFIRCSIEPLERTEHRVIPVTTVARTLFDLGTVDAKRVPKALEQADVLGLLDTRELRSLVDDHPRRPGTRAIRIALAAAAGWRGITRSELEDASARSSRRRLCRHPPPIAISISGQPSSRLMLFGTTHA